MEMMKTAVKPETEITNALKQVTKIPLEIKNSLRIQGNHL